MCTKTQTHVFECSSLGLSPVWSAAWCLQAEWEHSRKELEKARHDVERLRKALNRSDAEKRDQQQKASAARQALQVGTDTAQSKSKIW